MFPSFIVFVLKRLEVKCICFSETAATRPSSLVPPDQSHVEADSEGSRDSEIREEQRSQPTSSPPLENSPSLLADVPDSTSQAIPPSSQQ